MNGIVLVPVPEIPRLLKLTKVKDFILQECRKRGVAIPEDSERKTVNLRNAYAVPRSRQQLRQVEAVAIARGGKCLSSVYTGSHEKLLWQCEKMHRWRATSSDIKTGKWCPYCRGFYRTIEDMQALAVKRGGKCLSKTFLCMNEKLRWACDKGHKWEAIPQSVMRGSWCPVCAGTQRLTIEDIRKTARERGGKCLSNKYVNGVTKLRWRCSKGHEWEAVPDSIRQGTWCPRCGAKHGGRKPGNRTPR
jgi:hypothetical protein